MRLVKFRVKNFQSFSDSGEITFGPTFNLIIGQNNSGKSSLLRAMLPSMPDDRHRTEKLWETFKLPPPEAHFTINFEGGELAHAILKTNSEYKIPIPETEKTRINEYVWRMLSSNNIVYNIKRQANSAFTSVYPATEHTITHSSGQKIYARL